METFVLLFAQKFNYPILIIVVLLITLRIGYSMKRRYYTSLPSSFRENSKIYCKSVWKHPTAKGKYFSLLANSNDERIVYLGDTQFSEGELFLSMSGKLYYAKQL